MRHGNKLRVTEGEREGDGTHWKFSRDLYTLKEKYDVKEIQPVDMFPHTYHVETVALLTLKS